MENRLRTSPNRHGNKEGVTARQRCRKIGSNKTQILAVVFGVLKINGVAFEEMLYSIVDAPMELYNTGRVHTIRIKIKISIENYFSLVFFFF